MIPVNLVASDVGNLNAKSITDSKVVVIRNIAVPYDGTDDELQALGLFGELPGERIDSSPEHSESVRFIFGGKQWLVGAAAHKLSLRTRTQTTYSRYGTEEWHALVAATLYRLYPKFPGPGPIALTFSLPVSQIRAGRRSEIAEMLTGQWEVQDIDGKEYVYEIPQEHIDIVPEGFGSLAYLCLSESGRKFIDRDLAGSRVVVFDFGGYNLGVSTFSALSLGTFNESFTKGIIHVRNEVARGLKRRYNRSDIPDHILDEVIRTKQYKHAGHQPESVADIVDEASEDIINLTLRIWNEDLDHGADQETVVITGGGGPAFGDILKPQLGHGDVRILPHGEAHVASAIGMLRHRKFKQQYTLAQQQQ